MSRVRNDVIDWAEAGRIRPDAIRDALRVAEVTPTPPQWRRFLDRLALWLGVILLASGVIFFFAFNWSALGRFAKFGLVELPLAAAIVLAWRLRLDNFKGKALLLGAALLMGALLALIGQTYQTGADTYELFAAWALAILPWAAVGRFGALWLLWIGLINLAVWFYYHAFGGLFGMLLWGGLEKFLQVLWAFFILNTTALLVWELAASRLTRLDERWSVRILAVASGGLATALVLWALIQPEKGGGAAWVAYIAWIIVAYLVYRHWRRDLFALAAGALSVIVMVTGLLSKALITNVTNKGGAGALLMIGLVVIGMSAGAAYWLKSIAAEGAS